jgi:hypothetical protein
MPDSSGSVVEESLGTPLRHPHRPAPPVPPSTSSPLTPRRNNNGADDDEDVDAITKVDSDGESIYGVKRPRKTKHPMSRRTLRQRKIYSLKRQIVIKEKMLEVIYWPLYILIFLAAST